MVDPYVTLGVARSATDAEIKAAYRALVMELHPDRTGGDEQKLERMKEVTCAYEVLSDPKKRAKVDEQLARGVSDITIEGACNLTANAIDLGRQFLEEKLGWPVSKLGPAAGPAKRFVSDTLGLFADFAKSRSTEAIRKAGRS